MLRGINRQDIFEDDEDCMQTPLSDVLAAQGGQTPCEPVTFKPLLLRF